MKNQMRAASVLHVQAGENRLSVEVTPDAVYFERETGSVFRIGEGGRYTVVFGEEFEVFHDLNKPFFGLTHTENGATVERLRLERDCFLEMLTDTRSDSGQETPLLVGARGGACPRRACREKGRTS